MSDLYERLLARCDDEVDLILSPQPYAAALRAVVERHKPRPCTQPCSLRHEHLICRECGADCQTIQDIAEKLGVTEGEKITDGLA